MSNIIEELRAAAKELSLRSFPPQFRPEDTIAWQAADEIEKLRAAIKMAIECLEDRDVIGASLTLTKALGEKE